MRGDRGQTGQSGGEVDRLERQHPIGLEIVKRSEDLKGIVAHSQAMDHGADLRLADPIARLVRGQKAGTGCSGPLFENLHDQTDALAGGRRPVISQAAS